MLNVSVQYRYKLLLLCTSGKTQWTVSILVTALEMRNKRNHVYTKSCQSALWYFFCQGKPYFSPHCCPFTKLCITSLMYTVGSNRFCSTLVRDHRRGCSGVGGGKVTDWVCFCWQSDYMEGSEQGAVMHQYTTETEREGKKKGERERSAWPSFIHPPPHPASRRRAIPGSRATSIVISSLQYLLQLPGTIGLAMTYNTNNTSHVPVLTSPLSLIFFTLIPLLPCDVPFVYTVQHYLTVTSYEET